MLRQGSRGHIIHALCSHAQTQQCTLFGLHIQLCQLQPAVITVEVHPCLQLKFKCICIQFFTEYSHEANIGMPANWLWC